MTPGHPDQGKTRRAMSMPASSTSYNCNNIIASSQAYTASKTHISGNHRPSARYRRVIASGSRQKSCQGSGSAHTLVCDFLEQSPASHRQA